MSMDSKVGKVGPLLGCCLVGLGALHTLSCPILGSFLRPIGAMTIPSTLYINKPPFLSIFKPNSHIHTELKAFQSSPPYHTKLISYILITTSQI
ncbi:hypothetical protein RchiOBHm_Chr4g0435831 [Rosa chinensis]|uniref:Uncharacterized protein n=1 Tax=Rosa chinensis TaxID=74649 RepID=A0A2P6R1V8_ROSCH|nr:hypothetical protein RchiOBHm_Chr4g0435831 [Rosa chinensis]